MTKRWARQLCRRHPELPALELVGAVVNLAARALGVPPPAPVTAELESRIGAEAAPPGGWGDPWLAGAVHEMAASEQLRRARGAWYTPRPVVEGLLGLAGGRAAGETRAIGGHAGGVGVAPDLVIDPTCGGGGFLLAALDRLVAQGVGPDEAVDRVAGMDIDPDAVTVSGWALQLWWASRSGPGAGPVPAFDLVVGDALGPWPQRWQRPALVVGNPPFASPLRTGALSATANRFRQDRADVLGPYADLAALHLLRAVEAAGPGSTVALVQPLSTLAGRDTEGLRAHLAVVAPLRALWAAREAVFDAGVRTCAVVLDRAVVEPAVEPASGTGPVGAGSVGTGWVGLGPLGAGPLGAGSAGSVVLADGSGVQVRGRVATGPWGCLAADALGAPALPPMGSWGRLGDLTSATAGFRDEHYALVAACRDDGTGGGRADGDRADGDRAGADGGDGAGGSGDPRLVTVGAVEPLWTAWGSGPIRFGRNRWERPVIERSALPPKVLAWLERQLRPKVVLATQTRLLEPCVDRRGVIAPATPLIAVHAGEADLDRVAAVLLAPPVTAWAWRRWFGTAMAVDAVKLAARQVGELPLPPDRAAWDAASALVAGADGANRERAREVSVAVAGIMTEAYGASDVVFEWWLARFDGGR